MWMLQWWPLLRWQEDRAPPLGNWKEDDDGEEQALGALTAIIAEATLVTALSGSGVAYANNVGG